MTVKAAPRGAHVSNKEIARAAVEGRYLLFYSAEPREIIRGYPVGMDDYHWKIVTPFKAPEDVGQQDRPDLGIQTSLVHKGLAAVVAIGPSYLEKELFKKEIAEIGAPFWKWCLETYSLKIRPSSLHPEDLPGGF